MISIGEVSFKFVLFLQKQKVEVSGNWVVQEMGQCLHFIFTISTMQQACLVSVSKKNFSPDSRLKEMICFYCSTRKKKRLDKDKSIKMLTYSSQPKLPCFHVMNIQRMAVTNQKRLKLLTKQVVMHATQSTFSVLSLLPSCCIQALISEGRT